MFLQFLMARKLKGKATLCLLKKKLNFRSVLPGIPYVGELNFGFGGSDAVRLYDPNGTLQDEVDYQSLAPWPICADASGYTLELVSPDLDNDLPESWACINVNGSPNAANDQGFDQLSPTRQMIAIPIGWSMFSTYMIAEDMDLASVVSPIVDDVIIIKDFNGAAYLKEWNFNGVGDLQVGQGYQIKTTTEASLEIFGDYAIPNDYPITLSPGWNLIGYLKLGPSDAASVFSDINDLGNLVIVKDYSGSAYLPSMGFNGIGDMHPSRGYQIKVLNEDVLKYLPND